LRIVVSPPLFNQDLRFLYGLQVDQIAFRLGTHIKTVEKQLYSARKKLGARNTTQAVIKGLLLGQIEL